MTMAVGFLKKKINDLHLIGLSRTVEIHEL